ncbi:MULTISPECIES: hypothetical protein [unclassified Moorena]|uniref:Uncharacterized protein n=1 Tax=Moorena producens 3L TaxID=489825 RepID=F4XTN7_9CYAN|nr:MULTISPECIES: hypothetical protein [unclassified Moorena]EGJ31863.1 hypothetical protein LYNGBM3L_32150 [Moorena producens 3L]NEP32460.1 hypothetical protein [Moorena sp. SIO3B2]NEQ12699.1 hypothetical protein [Moorena sp. SIO3E2]NEQ06446.1 hypothetical protein [Moorena sp. SIO4E2]NER89233.1 hypothetical protein [Moorena sp. SIO3A2]
MGMFVEWASCVELASSQFHAYFRAGRMPTYFRAGRMPTLLLFIPKFSNARISAYIALRIQIFDIPKLRNLVLAYF